MKTWFVYEKPPPTVRAAAKKMKDIVEIAKKSNLI